MGRSRDRRSSSPDRTGSPALCRRTIAVVDGPGLPAPVIRRQCHARGRAVTRSHRQSRQIRGRLSLPQWLGHARRGRGLSDGRPSQARVRAHNQPHGFGRPARSARDQGDRHLEQQHRRVEPPSSGACAARSSATTCCKSRSTCSRPTPSTMPTTCSRRRAFSNSTTWSCRISTSPSRRR